jgi:subtilisin family serine protease
MSEGIFTLPPFLVENIVASLSAGDKADWGHDLLGVPRLWRLSLGKGVKVAVLDSGCDRDHPDLQGAVSVWLDTTNSATGPGDSCGHGTFCCGVIGARRNETGVVGVAPECELLSIKVLGDDGSGSIDQVVRGIDLALEHRADIISLSLGTSSPHPELERVCRKAVAQGTIVVASAGNSGPSLDTVLYPAHYDVVISVGAIDISKQIARFSSRGKRVDVVAPGVQVYSCYPGGRYAYLSGTSMAAPYVSGILALYLSYRRLHEGPQWKEEVLVLKKRLLETAVDLGPPGFDFSYGYGLINPESLFQLKESHEANEGQANNPTEV